jgi:hypothetical protein
MDNCYQVCKVVGDNLKDDPRAKALIAGLCRDGRDAIDFESGADQRALRREFVDALTKRLSDVIRENGRPGLSLSLDWYEEYQDLEDQGNVRVIIEAYGYLDTVDYKDEAYQTINIVKNNNNNQEEAPATMPRSTSPWYVDPRLIAEAYREVRNAFPAVRDVGGSTWLAERYRDGARPSWLPRSAPHPAYAEDPRVQGGKFQAFATDMHLRLCEAMDALDIVNYTNNENNQSGIKRFEVISTSFNNTNTCGGDDVLFHRDRPVDPERLFFGLAKAAKTQRIYCKFTEVLKSLLSPDTTNNNDDPSHYYSYHVCYSPVTSTTSTNNVWNTMDKTAFYDVRAVHDIGPDMAGATRAIGEFLDTMWAEYARL